jgi:hypothetical protein
MSKDPTGQLLLRKEIFALGGRHRGDALAGALIELREADVTPERKILLRAVVHHLTNGDTTPSAPANSSRLKYGLILGAASLCAAVQLWSITH